VTDLQARKATVECAVYSGDVKTAEGKVLAVRFSLDKSLGAGDKTEPPREHQVS